MNSEVFIGPFKKYLTEFYEYKINLGYVYNSQKDKLKCFDKFTLKYPKATKISKEILEDFLNSKEIKKSSKSAFSTVLRELCKYLNAKEIEAYVLPFNKYSRGKEVYVPHIFTEEEIKLFFETAKKYSKENEYKNTIVYTVFKLLYCTGMRISECLNIKIKDIDFNNQTISIYNTKNTESIRNLILMNTFLDMAMEQNIMQILFMIFLETYYIILKYHILLMAQEFMILDTYFVYLV